MKYFMKKPAAPKEQLHHELFCQSNFIFVIPKIYVQITCRMQILFVKTKSFYRKIGNRESDFGQAVWDQNAEKVENNQCLFASFYADKSAKSEFNFEPRTKANRNF